MVETMLAIIVLAAYFAAVAALPADSQRIAGGSLITINQYPSIVSMLNTQDGSTFRHTCGGTIINTRSILTAAHCTFNDAPARWRPRVGSSFANSGGVVHTLISILNHPNYNIWSSNNDIAIVRTASNIVYVANAVRPGSFAGANFNVPDNSVVWAAGYGWISENGPSSEQLRHVHLSTVNIAECRARYSSLFITITDNMLCAGPLDIDLGQGQCNYDSGGPLDYGRVIIGVYSFGNGCGRPEFPGVNTRVARYAAWIQANA